MWKKQFSGTFVSRNMLVALQTGRVLKLRAFSRLCTIYVENKLHIHKNAVSWIMRLDTHVYGSFDMVIHFASEIVFESFGNNHIISRTVHIRYHLPQTLFNGPYPILNLSVVRYSLAYRRVVIKKFFLFFLHKKKLTN